MREGPDQSGQEPVARATALVRLFHPRAEDFGAIDPVAPHTVGEPHRTLLDHCSHMTAAMERFHGGPVSLRVIDASGPHREGNGSAWYAREILLSRGDGRVVQHGIVRLDLSALPEAAAAAVVDARQPLGRILMTAGVLCDVQDVALVAIRPGSAATPHLGTHPTVGRVATIRVDGRPAIELLEIVADAGGG